MKSRTDLFELIRALSKSEKRYFKVFSTRQGLPADHKSIRLFDAIAAQAEPDDAALRKLFQGTPLARHLAAEKHQLYERILKSMRAFHAEADVAARLRQMVRDILFLEEKRLFRQAERAIRKSKALAWQFERTEEVLYILEIERRIVRRTEGRDLSRRLGEMREERHKALRLLLNRYEYADLYDYFYVAVQTDHQAQSEEQKAAVEALANKPLFNRYAAARTFRARLHFHSSHAIYHQLMAEPEKTLRHYESIVGLWKSNPHAAADDAFNYRKSLFNLLTACQKADRMEAFPDILNEIREIPFRTSDEALEMGPVLRFYDFAYHLNRADFEGARSLVPGIEEDLNSRTARIRPFQRLSIYYNLAQLFFFLDDARSAKAWLNEILHRRKDEVRKDIQEMARVMLLIVYFDQGEQALLEYIFRSTYRYLYAQKRIDPFKREVLAAMRRLYQAVDDAGYRVIFRELKAALDGLARQAEMKNMLGLQELRFWLRSKLEGLPLAEVAREELAGG